MFEEWDLLILQCRVTSDPCTGYKHMYMYLEMRMHIVHACKERLMCPHQGYACTNTDNYAFWLGNGLDVVMQPYFLHEIMENKWNIIHPFMCRYRSRFFWRCTYTIKVYCEVRRASVATMYLCLESDKQEPSLARNIQFPFGNSIGFCGIASCSIVLSHGQRSRSVLQRGVMIVVPHLM